MNPISSPGKSTLQATKIGDRLVDKEALTFEALSTFGSSINGQAFQKDIIRTFKGWQYVVYYDGKRRVCIGRCKLPDGPWEIVRFEDYDFTSTDTHNTISLGICEADGTLHLAFDHHVHPLHYRVSKPGVALEPEKHKWEASLFGPVHADLIPGENLTLTYPYFIATPDGGLQFNYRIGSSGVGNSMLIDYDPKTGTWSGTRACDSGVGVYKDELGTNDHRNAYPNEYDYDDKGRLHVTWVWRENYWEGNHDLCYVYSDDRGKTWKTNDGTTVKGAPGVETPGLVAVPVSRLKGIINTQGQTVDSQGQPHALMYYCCKDVVPPAEFIKRWEAKDLSGYVWGERTDRNYHHFWRDKTGKWHDDLIPWVAGSRPKLFVDAQDNLVLVYNFPSVNKDWQGGAYFTEGELTIATATAKANWQDWKIVVSEKDAFLNEILGDPVRWKSEGVLSVVAQETPKVFGQPSPIRVLDYRFTNAA